MILADISKSQPAPNADIVPACLLFSARRNDAILSSRRSRVKKNTPEIDLDREEGGEASEMNIINKNVDFGNNLTLNCERSMMSINGGR